MSKVTLSKKLKNVSEKRLYSSANKRAKADRNFYIYKSYRKGKRVIELAKENNITRCRVNQIIHKVTKDVIAYYVKKGQYPFTEVM